MIDVTHISIRMLAERGVDYYHCKDYLKVFLAFIDHMENMGLDKLRHLSDTVCAHNGSVTHLEHFMYATA